MTTNTKTSRARSAVTASALGCILLANSASGVPPSHSLLAPGNADVPGLVTKRSQMASQLCWAATAQMAINAVAFDPLHPMTQELQAAIRAAGSRSAAAFPTWRTRCETAIGKCNLPGKPILGPWLGSKPVPMPLSPEQIAQEIGESKRPFIFKWHYKKEKDGVILDAWSHYFIAVGYDTSADPDDFLQIVDPYPENEGAVTTISYQQYSDPDNDTGLEVTHEETLFQLTKAVRPVAPASGAPWVHSPFLRTNLMVQGSDDPNDQSAHPTGPSEPARGRAVTFTVAVRASMPRVQRERILKRPRPWLKNRQGALTLGVPFPIIALHLDDIIAAKADPARLMAHETDAVLFPVMAGNEVVDSLIMVLRDGHWIEKGYSNPVVTAQLVAVRHKSFQEHHVPLQDYFLISVPQFSAFFASYGSGKQTWAIPSSTDATIHAVQGVQQHAIAVLSNIAAEAERSARYRQ